MSIKEFEMGVNPWFHKDLRPLFVFCPYSATAYYKGIKTSNVITEYEGKVTYTGLVTKKIAIENDKVIANEDNPKPYNPLPVVSLTCGGLLAIIAFAVWILIKYRKVTVK